MKKVILLMFFVSFALLAGAKSKKFNVASPDGRIEVAATVSDKLFFTVSFDGKVIVGPSEIAMALSDRVLGEKAVVKKAIKNAIDETITPVVKIKEASITNRCNELSLQFSGDYALTFRVYNEGMAYRFETMLGDEISVKREIGEYEFPENYTCWLGRGEKVSVQ